MSTQVIQHWIRGEVTREALDFVSHWALKHVWKGLRNVWDLVTLPFAVAALIEDQSAMLFAVLKGVFVAGILGTVIGVFLLTARQRQSA